MAYKYTSEFSFYNNNRWARGYVEAWVHSETDTTATIYWRILCQQKSAALYGQEANGYVDGSWVGWCGGHIDSSSSDWKNVCSNSGYVTVNKTTAARNVPVAISTRVTPIDGYGSVTTDWYDATCYVPISAKTSYAVKYNLNGGEGTAPSAQTKWHGETLELSDTKPTRTGYTFQGWGTSSTDTSVNYAAGADYTANKAITLYAIWKVVKPAAPSELSVTRNSDTKNTLSWTRGADADITYSSIKIERRVDGGSWSEIESVSGTATSYADTTTSADHYYEYRIRAYNTTGYSSYATCSTVLYNTPSAPTKVVAARSGETTVELTITNAPNTATALEIQRSTDAATWETVATVEGAAVAEATDNPGGGTFYYRARNTRGSLVSAWSAASNAVVTICAPAAPTLKAPASGMVVSKAIERIVFEWLHNAIDGSAQTAAKLRYSLDKGATWVDVVIEGSTASYEIENAFAVNSEVTWSVCTKGAHADYGPWSDNRVFYVYQAPSVAFAQPTDGFVVENTPIAIQLQYDDPSGTLAGATLSISDGSRTVYTRNMGSDTGCDILKNEWLPENGATYDLTIDVRSSSTLTATATREVTVSFVLPSPATLTIEPDPETGYVSLIAEIVPDEELESPVSISVYRIYDGQSVLLGEDLPDGAGLVDMYAPLNEDYQYEVATFADSGAANRTMFGSRVTTDWAFMYFGDSLARCKWNPKWSHDMDPSAEYVHYMGDTYPTAHMDDFIDEVYPVTALVIGREESRAFRKMMMAREPIVAKLWRGDVFWAVPKLSEKAQQGRAEWYEVSVNLNRVEGDAL